MTKTTVQASTTSASHGELISMTKTGGDSFAVYRNESGGYSILRNDIVQHAEITADEVMRALTDFVGIAILGKLETCTTLRRMKVPEDSGPIRGEDIAQRMMNICGCAGKYDCDCVSVQNRAQGELWFEHNQAKKSIADR